MTQEFGHSLENLVDSDSLTEVSETQNAMYVSLLHLFRKQPPSYLHHYRLSKMAEINSRLESFTSKSEQKLPAAQLACNAYVTAMKSISTDIQNIFHRVRLASYLSVYYSSFLASIQNITKTASSKVSSSMSGC